MDEDAECPWAYPHVHGHVCVELPSHFHFWKTGRLIYHVHNMHLDFVICTVFTVITSFNVFFAIYTPLGALSHSCFLVISLQCFIMLHVTEFVVIHNGIITNYKEIKTYLVSCLCVFGAQMLLIANFKTGICCLYVPKYNLLLRRY